MLLNQMILLSAVTMLDFPIKFHNVMTQFRLFVRYFNTAIE